MSNESIPDIFGDILKGKFGFSESDIISMYIDGRIDKDEMIRRLDNVRRNKSN